ncbi:ABC transporter substrate-binding protein [Rhizohabitans arisaemae]|uniref:ABC transporter substrate-binding protein n=1 Tax=Rhizohabitans arisaemae TaxID=2720610 RepID=UPI0024B0E284|nr:ABC transporter substrate-binding protein [Rhizohabitans arisaemae]
MTVITVGMRLPDPGHLAPLLIGTDRGFYAEEGLEVRTVVTEDLVPGILDGGLTFADMPSTALLGDAGKLPIRLISGWHGRRDYWMAVAPGVSVPADLAGRRVILGAPSDQPVRLRLLAEAGFPLDGVDCEPVNPPGGSDVWIRQLLSGEAGMAPIFLRHRREILDAGCRLVLDVSKDWPSNSVGASTAFLAANPAVATGFLRATLRAMEIWMDPGNAPDVLEIWAKHGIRITPEQRDTYVEGFLRPYGRADLTLREDEFAELIAMAGLPQVPFSAYTDPRYLQEALRR